MSDPRVFFAAERTLLAWVRSGLTVMALGFVVARFGLFLSVMEAASKTGGAAGFAGRWPSSALGIVLVMVGAMVILGAVHNHRLYVRQLPPADIPAVRLPWLSTCLAMSVAVIGLLLAVYLALT